MRYHIARFYIWARRPLAYWDIKVLKYVLHEKVRRARAAQGTL